MFASIISQILFLDPYLSYLLPGLPLCVCWKFMMVSHRSLQPFSFFFDFFLLCSSDWLIYTDLFSGLLILCFTILNLLSSGDFVISIITLFTVIVVEQRQPSTVEKNIALESSIMNSSLYTTIY